jgi:carbamoyltransferase
MSFILSIHTGHDANMTIFDIKNNKLICYIEFEKVANQRYFKFNKDAERFKSEFKILAWPFIEPHLPKISKINLCWVKPGQEVVIKNFLPNTTVDSSKRHHLMHAYSVYAFTKAKKGDVIVSYDGGGDLDDYFWIYSCSGKSIKPIGKNIAQNLGVPYRYLGLVSHEINSTPTFELESNQHLAGKVMGLAPRGKITPKFVEPLQNYYRFFSKTRKAEEIELSIKTLLSECGLKTVNVNAPKKSAKSVVLNTTDATNLLRTSQNVFEEEFWHHVGSLLEDKTCKRILLTGGCALNVKLNSLIFDRTGKDVFVIPVPGDCGISLGATVKDIGLTKFKPFEDAFIGPHVSGNLIKYIRTKKGKAAKIGELAKLLHEGKLIGTIIGQIEAGPRALGNRSLLANPCFRGMKDKLNKVKEREKFRPVAPLVTSEMQSVYFEGCPVTKYMSFSPKIKKTHAKNLQEVVHYDGTCRIQTVTKSESFLHELLVSVGKLTGYEVLINTSFNTKGRPIINNIDEAFELLESSQIDYLYIDGFLFGRDN